MTTLIKDVTLAIPGEPEVPGTPAYCIDTPTPMTWMSFYDQHRVYGTPLPPVPSGASANIGTAEDWHLTHGSYITVVFHQCFPAVPAVPGTPGRPAEFNIGWNAGGRTIDYLDATGQYSSGQFKFSVPHDVSGVVVGFNDYPSDGQYYGDIDYALYFTLGMVVVCENGVQIGLAIPYESDDIFAIVRLGDEIRYFKNDTMLRSFTPDISLGALWGDAALYFGGDRVVNAEFAWDIEPQYAIVQGAYEGNLGNFTIAAGDDDTAGIAELSLGDMVLQAYGASNASYAGDLGDFVVAAYDHDTVFAELDLGDFVVSALPQPFEPDYAGVAVDLGDLHVFAVALNGGAVPEVALDLGDFNFYAADANYGIYQGNLGELTLFAFGELTANGALANIMLPMLRTTMQVFAGANATAVIELPLIEVEGYTGGVAEIELPMLEVSGDLIVPAVMRGEITLPALEVSGDGKAGALLHGSIALPTLQATYYPAFIPSGSWGLPGQPGLWLPMLEVSGTGYEPAIVTGDISLPALEVAGTVTTGAYNSGYIVLPALDTAAGMSGAIVLPALAVAGHAAKSGTTLKRTWVMNLANGAVTEFSNYAFKAMGFAYDYYWGIGMDGGLWQMGGDTDNDVPIDWEWLSGITDFDMVSEKGLKALYLDGVINGDITVTVLSDDATRVYDHAAGNSFNHKPHRVKIGMGIRSRSYGFGMASESGAYIELDKVTPEYIVTKRNM